MNRKWKVWNVDDGEEADAIEVEALTAEWAVEAAAQQMDNESAHELFDFNQTSWPKVNLCVRGDDGEKHEFVVSCEFERVYSAEKDD